MSKRSCWIGGILAAVTVCLTLQAKTFPEIRAAAEKGDADAQFELGIYYSVGICVKMDEATAKKWYLKAADQGHVAARSTCLSEGYGVEKDLEKAGEVARQAAETGDPWGQFCMGTYYGVKAAPEQSIRWFRKAADQGNGWAQVFLGMGYLGIMKGAPEDPEQAFFWLKKAAEQGNAMGQILLGGCYISGTGVPKDREKAAYWLRQAAEQGCEQAKAALKKLEQ